MRKTSKEISLILKNELPKLKSVFNVVSVDMFGSYVREEQRLDSDLDILVTFLKSPSLFEFVKLENYLSDLIGVKVDLVMRSALKPNIGKQIISEARPV